MANLQNFGYHDICATIVLRTLCDGTYDPEGGYKLYCGTSSFALRKTVVAATEQEAPNSSATTGRRCLYRRTPATPGDCFLDWTTCGIEDAELWSWLGAEAPILDPETGDICGYEEPVVAENKCVSCGKESSACAHQLAVITLHNKWCGEDQRSLDAPYMARIHRSLLFEPVDQQEDFGQGFTFFRQFTATLQRNPNFVDPFGIDTRTGVTSKYSALKVPCPDDSPIEELINQSCECALCDGLTIAESSEQQLLVA